MKSEQPEKLVIFAVDDDQGELEILMRYLEQMPGFEIDFHTHDGSSGMIEMLTELDVDLIFLDYQLGVRTGIEVLEELRAMGVMESVVALTGHGDEYAAAKLTQAGADDYLAKGDLGVESLQRSIKYARSQYGRRLAESQLLRHAWELEEANRRLRAAKKEVETANERLRELSNTDPLTRIANRRYFMERCETEFARMDRHPADLSLIAIDLDHFKRVNDRYGHQVGDRALVEVANVLQQALRKYDIVARLGGEEFALLLPGTDLENAVVVAERCREAVETIVLSLTPGGETIELTASAGVACSPGQAPTSVDELIRRADELLYRAKDAGRNCVVAAD